MAVAHKARLGKIVPPMGRPLPTIQRDLARNIRATRRAMGLSQEALALNADVDRTYVSKLERRVGNPSIRVLEQLSYCLGVDVVDLLKTTT